MSISVPWLRKHEIGITQSGADGCGITFLRIGLLLVPLLAKRPFLPIDNNCSVALPEPCEARGNKTDKIIIHARYRDLIPSSASDVDLDSETDAAPSAS